MMEEFRVLERKLIILSTKVSFKMIFITAMEDIFILMEITILETGKMERDRDGEDQSTNPERSMRECGNTVNLWEIECLSNLNLIKDFKIIIIKLFKMQ